MKRAIVEVEGIIGGAAGAWTRARDVARKSLRPRRAGNIFATHSKGPKRLALVAERDIVRPHGTALTHRADAELRDGLEKVYRDAALEAPTFDEAIRAPEAPGKPRERAQDLQT